MSFRAIPEPWLSFLSDIDASLAKDVELHCLGGFVVSVLYNLARPTADVDVVAITPRSEIESLMRLAGQGSDLHRKHKVHLQLVGVATLPERNTQRDRDDVKLLAQKVPFDLSALKTGYEKDLRPILGNPKREDLTLRLWIEAIEEERQISP